MEEKASDSLEVRAGDQIEAVRIESCTSPAGHKFVARPGTEDADVFRSVTEFNEYMLPAEFEPDDVVIDVGAHIGSFSYAVLTRGADKVYAYEAHPANYAIARQNLARFGDRVKCFNRAVWRSDEPVQTLYNNFITDEIPTGGISVLWNNEGVPVETVSFDDILFEASNGLKNPIRLLKLDCEGSEYPILFTSKNLGIVKEICGEYHIILSDRLPERVKILGNHKTLDGHILKRFLEGEGWSVELEPKGETNGLFFALPKSRRSKSAQETFVELEIDVDDLMGSIREAAAKREARGHAALIDATTKLYRLLSARQAPATPAAEALELRLQPAFEPRPDDHYHVNDLLKYHDHDFVRNAYRAILKRAPDQQGLLHHLENLRAGRFNKLDVLAGLRYSAEGESKEVRIEGLRLPAMMRRLYHLPALGYVLQVIAGVARLPASMRSQRQLESYLITQQHRVAHHVNQLTNSISQKLSEVAQEQRKLYDEQTKAIDLQYQQVGALLHEQKQLAARQQSLKADADARLTAHEKSIETQVEALTQRIEHLSRKMQQTRAEWASQERRLATMLEGMSRQSPAGTQAGDSPIAATGEEGHGLDALYASFEDQFRGRREDIKERLSIYLPLLREARVAADVLDIGCGRGEWLELLKESGIRGRGVDTNRVFVENCRQSGFDVVGREMLAYLHDLPENSLGAVTAFHVVEHVPFETMVELLDEIMRTLRPGGLVIIETPSAENLVVAACNFHSDPTHHKPIFPQTLRFVLDNRGFVNLRHMFLHPGEESPFKDSEALRPLHNWFYGPRDYAIIGSKP